MNRKAQIIGQIFVFILAGVVFVLILGYGYNAITSFIEKGEQVQLLDFRNQLDSTITLIKRDYGSVQQVDLRMPPKTSSVCFVNSPPDLTGAQQSALKQDYALLESSWSTGSENIFLIPRQPTPMLIKDVVVFDEQNREKGYCCVAVSGGRVLLLRVDDIDWIEAADNYVELHVGKQSDLLREKPSPRETRLVPEKFVRISRSTIVDDERLKEHQPLFRGAYAVILQSGERLTLSRSYRDKLRQFGLG